MPIPACSSFFVNQAVCRREVLQAGALSLFGLGLPNLLRAREGTTDHPVRAKACILLFMWGGPAQQDTWDMKPDAPSEYRGEFRPIATKVPGVQICEHLPRLARLTDRLAIVRSLTHTDVDHTAATHFLLTGRAVPNRNGPEHEDWPNYGAVISYLLERQEWPRNVYGRVMSYLGRG